MNKLLNVPDELMKDIKVLAAMKDMSVKKYLEEVIVNAVTRKQRKGKKN